MNTSTITKAVVANTRRLASDSGAFADWVASSSTNAAVDKTHDLSLGFNAGPSTAGPTHSSGPIWPTSSRAQLGYGLPHEMGMFVVAPATSFHHPTTTQHESLIPDPHHTLNSVGVIPLLTAIDGEDLGGRNRTGAIHLWQNQQHQMGNYPKKTINFDQSGAPNLVSSTSGGVGSSGGATTCQDCGNQAKKDCTHRRCRTCCRSRGFECSTHVKSTWVPAARRRERQTMGGAVGTGGGGGASSGSTSGAKKPRLSQNTTTTSHTSTSNTPPRSFDTSSSHQEASIKESLPGQVTAPAVFKCVRVTSVEDGEDEYAYQAVVKIGGHVFKGFLYDQGVEPREGFPNLSELHLGGSSGGGGGGGSGGASSSGGGRNAGSTSLPLLDPSDVFGTTGTGHGTILGGASYGNTIN